MPWQTSDDAERFRVDRMLDVVFQSSSARRCEWQFVTWKILAQIATWLVRCRMQKGSNIPRDPGVTAQTWGRHFRQVRVLALKMGTHPPLPDGSGAFVVCAIPDPANTRHRSAETIELYNCR